MGNITADFKTNERITALSKICKITKAQIFRNAINNYSVQEALQTVIKHNIAEIQKNLPEEFAYVLNTMRVILYNWMYLTDTEEKYFTTQLLRLQSDISKRRIREPEKEESEMK